MGKEDEGGGFREGGGRQSGKLSTDGNDRRWMTGQPEGATARGHRTKKRPTAARYVCPSQPPAPPQRATCHAQRQANETQTHSYERAPASKYTIQTYYLVVQDESEASGGGDRKVEVRVRPVGLVVRRHDLHLISGLRQKPRAQGIRAEAKAKAKDYRQKLRQRNRSSWATYVRSVSDVYSNKR